MIDAIVDRYEEVAAELEIDVQEVETSVFSAERTSDSTRIYRLKREALEFRRAVVPLRDPVVRFATTAEPPEARPYFRDIADHLWTYGYPICLAVIGSLCLYVYRRFKRSGWL